MAETQVIEGIRTVVAEARTTLPASMPDLLRDMDKFGFAFRDDFPMKGTRVACETLRVHRFRRFREGRWFNTRAFDVVIGQGTDAAGQPEVKVATVAAGVRELRLLMCEDCGAVCVRDMTPHPWTGGRAARLINRQTGRTRLAPATARHDLVIGWYSGKRRAGREYKGGT